MSALRSIAEVTAFDSLRFVFETGASARDTEMREPASSPALLVPTTEGEEKEGAQTRVAAASSDAALPTNDSPADPAEGPSLPGLRRLVEAQWRWDAARVERGTRARGQHPWPSLSASSSVALGSRRASPLTPMVPSPVASASAPASTMRAESFTAVLQVAVELVRGVMDRVLYGPDKAVGRYEDALMHLLHGSPLAQTAQPRLLDKWVVNNGADVDSLSDCSDASQRPYSPRGFTNVSYPAQAVAHAVPSCPLADALRRERRMLLSRYETCCEVMGSMPMSSVLDRLSSAGMEESSSMSSSAPHPDPRLHSATVSDMPTCGSSITLSSHRPATATAAGPLANTDTTAGLPRAGAGSEMGAEETSTPQPVHSRSPSARVSPAGEGGGGSTSGLHCADFSDCEGLGRPECLIPLLGLLEGFPQATFLSLAGVGLTDGGACVVALLCEAHLPHLRRLDLSRNPLVTHVSAEPLIRLVRHHRCLVQVDVDGTALSPLARAALDAALARSAARGTVADGLL